MRHAFAASGIVALVAGLTGYFLVLRAQSFAGHALGHIGFTGATGAVLIGLDPLWGLVLFTLAGGMVMGLLGERLAGRDVAIGMVLAVSLGLGVLFLYFFTTSASLATSLLFGDVLGIDRRTVLALAALGAVCLAMLGLIARPLLFASLQPELAEAAGVPLRLVGVLFLAVVALATAESASIVGVLLVFVLMIGPAAAAQAFCSARRPRTRSVRGDRPGGVLARPRPVLLDRLARELLDQHPQRRRVSFCNGASPRGPVMICAQGWCGGCA